jgi:hypothetical protein
LFDTSEGFVFSDNPPSNKISLPGTWCHENIHACGLNGHLGPGNLMGTTYDPRILRPQSADINELVIRYGLPSPDQPPPVPPTTPATPGTEMLRITVGGATYEFAGRRVG